MTVFEAVVLLGSTTRMGAMIICGWDVLRKVVFEQLYVGESKRLIITI